MGLGKTIQAVAFFVAVVGNRSDKEEFFKGSMKDKMAAKKKKKTVLLVTPASVMENWRREIRTNKTHRLFAAAAYVGQS